MIFLLLLVEIFAAIPFSASFAQKLVDPDKVAPEYRVAAEKRRAEQLKLLECSHKAINTPKARIERILPLAPNRSTHLGYICASGCGPSP